MSKALRIVTEGQLAPPSFSSLFSNWNSPSASIDISGNPPPCFEEFMILMKCVKYGKATECHTYYLKLLLCLQQQGFNDSTK
tara:strand:- start:89 stop:334 length:246 start_codon:yes stop_codon:yes gene_type:complete